VSVLYRSKRWLTLAQLVPAWAGELANATTGASECEQALLDSLLEDIITGRFDGMGLAFFHPDGAVPVQGRLLIGTLGLSLDRNRHRILVSKRAVLNFARRHRLPRPSWWVDKARTPKKSAADTRLATPAVATARKRRRGPEPGSVDRFGESDRALFPELERVMRDHRMSANAAARELASRIEGAGAEASKAKRLASRYLRSRKATR
jgi:hypothetical protein